MTTRGVNIATSKGVVVVVAQGNSGTSTKVSAIEIYNSGSERGASVLDLANFFVCNKFVQSFSLPIPLGVFLVLVY